MQKQSKATVRLMRVNTATKKNIIFLINNKQIKYNKCYYSTAKFTDITLQVW